MEDVLKTALNCESVRKRGGGGSLGGCISEGQSYILDEERTVFVKINSEPHAEAMFTGEMEGLKSILATNTVRVPQPIKVINVKGDLWIIVMEHIEMNSLKNYDKELGLRLAQLHLDNINKLKLSADASSRVHTSSSGPEVVDKFGFSVPTCCGLIPMPNDWECDWIKFYARHRLQPQIDRIVTKYGNRQIIELWSSLQLQMQHFFADLPLIQPSLLHGDLWGGNTAETDDGPVIFDPAVLYGHHEFDLSISKMFGGFGQSFYDAYHSLIPKSPGFDTRLKLYQLFHYLNHWNHFGSSYQEQSLSLMKKLTTSH